MKKKWLEFLVKHGGRRTPACADDSCHRRAARRILGGTAPRARAVAFLRGGIAVVHGLWKKMDFVETTNGRDAGR
jgi:hypothetical protein